MSLSDQRSIKADELCNFRMALFSSLDLEKAHKETSQSCNYLADQFSPRSFFSCLGYIVIEMGR